MSGDQCVETESDSDDVDENGSLYSFTQTTDAAPATSVTSPYHRHRQSTGSMSTFCRVLEQRN